MWLLPMALRAKMAAVILLGIFFIPFATSDLRGLTHVLTCTDAVSASLLVDDTAGIGRAHPCSARPRRVTREEAGLGLCGGLEVDLQLTSARDGRAEVLGRHHQRRPSTTGRAASSCASTTRRSRWPSAASPRATTERDMVELRVRSGRAYEITGTLLIGP